MINPGQEQQNRTSRSPRTAAEVSRAEQAAREAGAVVVEIYDQVYHLSGTDAPHIEGLAATVDAKMRTISANTTTVDSLRVAVLAALNLADELSALQARYTVLSQSTSRQQTSVSSLTGMLDSLLQERKAG